MVTQQQLLRNSGIASRLSRQPVQEVQTYEQQVQQIQQDPEYQARLKSYEEQVAQFQRQQKEINEWKIAQNLVDVGKGWMGGYLIKGTLGDKIKRLTGEDPKGKVNIKGLEAEAKALGKNIYDIESGLLISPEGQGMSIRPEELQTVRIPRGYQGIPTSEGVILQRVDPQQQMNKYSS